MLSPTPSVDGTPSVHPMCLARAEAAVRHSEVKRTQGGAPGLEGSADANEQHTPSWGLRAKAPYSERKVKNE